MIDVDLRIPSRDALKELARGAAQTVNDLKKREKSTMEAGLDASDLQRRLRFWQGDDSNPGIAKQLGEQVNFWFPTGDEYSLRTGQTDAFAQAPIDTDPNPSLPRADDVDPQTVAEQLQDLLAAAGVYIPAAVLRTWTDGMRAAAGVWAEAGDGDAENPEAETPERPAFLVDFPLPEGYYREGDTIYLRRGPDEEPEAVENAEEWAEADARRQIASEEAEAIAAQPGLRWVPIAPDPDTSIWQALHDITRERREVPAGWAAPEAEVEAQVVDGEEGAAEDVAALPEEQAVALALAWAAYLSDVDPDADKGITGTVLPAEEGEEPGAEPTDADLAIAAAAAFGGDAWEGGGDENDMPLEPMKYAEPGSDDGEPPFAVRGTKKPVLVEDQRTGATYGDEVGTGWTAREAEEIARGWNTGQAVRVRKTRLEVPQPETAAV